MLNLSSHWSLNIVTLLNLYALYKSLLYVCMYVWEASRRLIKVIVNDIGSINHRVRVPNRLQSWQLRLSSSLSLWAFTSTLWPAAEPRFAVAGGQREASSRATVVRPTAGRILDTCPPPPWKSIRAHPPRRRAVKITPPRPPLRGADATVAFFRSTCLRRRDFEWKQTAPLSLHSVSSTPRSFRPPSLLLKRSTWRRRLGPKTASKTSQRRYEKLREGLRWPSVEVDQSINQSKYF